MCNKNNWHLTQVTPFPDKISQISICDLLIQHLGTCNQYKFSLGVVEHQEVFWDEINSSTHGQGLLWNHLCSDTWKCLSWLSGTAQMDRDHSAPHSFLAFLLRPRCSQIQVPVQHFAALLSLPRPTPVQWIFSGILLKTWWHSTKPHGVFHSSATAATPGC